MQMPMSVPLSSIALSGIASDPLLSNIVASNAYLSPLPLGYDTISAVLIRDNLAVIPGDWNSGAMRSAFYEIETEDVELREALGQIKTADFVAWDQSFFDLVLGPEAGIETILSFPGVQHVHEAPVYVPETEELLFSDITLVGSLWAISVNAPYKTRNITTFPPLHNVNGGTYSKGTVYFLTNGSPVRGIYTVDPVSGTSQLLLNNFRGRHLNSPNDIIVDSASNLWFTDPCYGWYQMLSGVSGPELPNSIYFFNTTSKALITVSNSVALVPNGLAFSSDETVLYVSDSNSTSGRPVDSSPDSLRNIWAFDRVPNSTTLINPRLIYQHETGWPDGLRVTDSGFLMIAAAGGADIVDPRTGILLGKINTPRDIIFNVEGIPGTGVWFLTGRDSIYKVTLKEKARAGQSSSAL